MDFYLFIMLLFFWTLIIEYFFRQLKIQDEIEDTLYNFLCYIYLYGSDTKEEKFKNIIMVITIDFYLLVFIAFL